MGGGGWLSGVVFFFFKFQWRIYSISDFVLLLLLFTERVVDQIECKYSSNLQKHVTVSSTSNGSIIWPLVERSCRPIVEYRTLDNVFDAAPAVLRPTIVLNTFDDHITDDFSLVLPCRALSNHIHTYNQYSIVVIVCVCVYVIEFPF